LRASEKPFDDSAKINALIERAFAVPINAPSCGHFFPLFIIACEANTDEQRASILALINRTEKEAHVRSMKRFKSEIQSFWVQRDLGADDDIIRNYLTIMSAVVSSNGVVPSYA
jgi:hypothetical protein